MAVGSAAGTSDLSAHIEKKGVFGINLVPGCDPAGFFTGGTLRSDTDAQLIIFFPFVQTVKLASIVLEAPTSEDVPTLVKM
jgi:hypothetical protein